MSVNSKKYDFTGKVALVTGSSSVNGIGAAIAYQFAQYGAKVIIHGRNADTLNKVAEKIHSETGHEPLKVVGDLLDLSFPSELIKKTITKYDRLDILVNNAGGGSFNQTFQNDNLMKDYDYVFGLNIRAPIYLTQLAAPYLEKTQGNVINISSIGSLQPRSMLYSSSKAALDMFTKTSAQELGPKGIRVNSINPGPILTGVCPVLANSIEEMTDILASMSLLNRVALPLEIANLASFLVSDDAANITGSIIISDSGRLIKKVIPNFNKKE